jgi:hypothetical protein
MHRTQVLPNTWAAVDGAAVDLIASLPMPTVRSLRSTAAEPTR